MLYTFTSSKEIHEALKGNFDVTVNRSADDEIRSLTFKHGERTITVRATSWGALEVTED